MFLVVTLMCVFIALITQYCLSYGLMLLSELSAKAGTMVHNIKIQLLNAQSIKTVNNSCH